MTEGVNINRSARFLKVKLLKKYKFGVVARETYIFIFGFVEIKKLKVKT